MRERRIRLAAWLIGLVVGGVQAWLTRQQLSSDDAIAYLDIGDAYLRGDWANAINAYWSPLYSWILGATLRVFSPSTAAELPLVKVVNFAVFVFAFVSFEVFWRRAMVFVEDLNDSPPPRWAMTALGYGVFLWTSLTFIGVSSDTPDMLVAAFTYLAAAAVLRLRSRATLASSAALGAVLAFGYLAKAAFFPLAFVFLAVAATATRNGRSTIVAAVTFAVIAAPFIGAISNAKRRLTFGDTGRLNYAWSMTRDVRPFRFWHRPTTRGGTPVHPPRVVSERPEVFEFAQPVGGTYPPWHDPSYWYHGLEVRVRPALLFAVVAANAWFYAVTFAVWLGVGWIALVGVSGLRDAVRRASRAWVLIVPALAGLGLYLIGSDLRAAMIPTQPSTRFIAAFVVLLVVPLVSAVTARPEQRRVAHVVGVAIALVCGALAWNVAKRVAMSNDEPARIAREQPAVADTLRALGIRPGDRIAISGYYLFPYFHWARLGRVSIAAEIFQADFFWEQSPTRRAEILGALHRAGVRAVVQRPGIVAPAESGWRSVGHGYYLFWL
jgi:hypothetical protein